MQMCLCTIIIKFGHIFFSLDEKTHFSPRYVLSNWWSSKTVSSCHYCGIIYTVMNFGADCTPVRCLMRWDVNHHDWKFAVPSNTFIPFITMIKLLWKYISSTTRFFRSIVANVQCTHRASMWQTCNKRVRPVWLVHCMKRTKGAFLFVVFIPFLIILVFFLHFGEDLA